MASQLAQDIVDAAAFLHEQDNRGYFVVIEKRSDTCYRFRTKCEKVTFCNGSALLDVLNHAEELGFRISVEQAENFAKGFPALAGCYDDPVTTRMPFE